MTIYLKGKRGQVPVEIEEREQQGQTFILASAESAKITAVSLGKQMMQKHPDRAFYIWTESDYVYTYSPPDGQPPHWPATKVV